MRTNLSIEVVSVEFDVGGSLLRINGKNVEENPFVKVCLLLSLCDRVRWGHTTQ